jgi:hypothetical protein
LLLCLPAACSRAAATAGGAAAGRLLFYKVPFQAVPDLVGSRRVLLRAGQAYVGEDQVGLLMHLFLIVLNAFAASSMSSQTYVGENQVGFQMAPHAMLWQCLASS